MPVACVARATEACGTTSAGGCVRAIVHGRMRASGDARAWERRACALAGASRVRTSRVWRDGVVRSRGEHVPLPGSSYPLGASWDGVGVNFALFSEHASAVHLCLFDSA